MEAKETVMSPIDVSKKVGEIVALSPMIGEAGVNIKIAELQAEISFKAGKKLSLEKQGQAYLEGKQAGIGEVVEWIEPFIETVDDGEFNKDWQTKLKEWGI